MALAGDLDEAATLNPTMTHESALAIAAMTGKPQLVPHQKMDSAAAMAAANKSASMDVSVRSGGVYNGDMSVRSGTAYSMADTSVRSGSAYSIGNASSMANPGGASSPETDERMQGGERKKLLAMQKFWSVQNFKNMIRTCFGYGADAKAEAINAEFMARVEDAFLMVAKEKDTQSLDIKLLGQLMQAITGGREIPKLELELMTKLFDPDITNLVTHESFAGGLMLIKDDPNLNRMLGQDLSRLLDHRSMHKESSTKLPSDASPFAIHPNHKWLRYFKKLMNLVGFFYFFEVPVRLTFRVAHRIGPWYLIAVHFVDALLLVDILVNMCTAYVNKKSVLTYKMHKIFKHYLSTTFLMDIIAAFPWDLIAMMSTTRRSATSYVDYTLMAYLRFPKLLRLYRVHQALKVGSGDLKADSISGVLRRLIPMLILINHVMACVIWWVSADTYIGNSTSDSMFARWSGLGTGDLMNLEGTASSEVISVLKQYLVSYFWVTATISTNGRIGDVNPITSGELAFTCVVMVLNLTLYSYALGEVSAAVMKQDEDLVQQRQNILSVEGYIQTRGLPENLGGQIRAHFDFLAKSATMHEGQEDGGAGDIFTQLSHSLQVEVSSYLSRDLIASCIAFRDSDDIFLDSMAVLLREVNMSSDQYLYRVNEVSRELFIISSGFVELTVENVIEGGDNVISIRQRGELCGELSFFFGIRQNTNARTSSTSTASFFCLPKEDYLQLLKLYPQEEENLTRNALAAFDDFSNGKDGTSSYASSTYSSEQGLRAGSSAAGSEASSTALASNVDTNALDDIATVRKVLNVARQKKLNEKIVSVITAAAKNDISEVSRMLAQGDINVDMGDYDERTPLHLAASNGHLKMVKHLVLIHGADLGVKDRYGGTPMVDAIRHKMDTCAAFLRSQGASLEVDDAAEQLCSAAAKNDVAALRRLVNNNVDPNLADYDKRTAMHLAASNGCMDALNFLIKIKGIELSPEDRLGGTPLADAIRHNHPEAQKLLREKGANLGNMDVSVRLCEAGASNDLEALKTYVRNGADLNVGDYDQRTALHLAASMGNLAAVSWILDKGNNVNVNVLDRMNCTPLDDAIREGHKVCALLLADRGAMTASDPRMKKARAELKTTMDVQKKQGAEERLQRAFAETEEMVTKSDLDKIVQEINVITRGVWFNLAMMFNHFWTITKLVFVYNNEPGYEILKKEGYGNVMPDELEAQIQETIGIIKKLITENISNLIDTLGQKLSDPIIKRAELECRLPLLGAGKLVEQVQMGKKKLAHLQNLLTELQEECEVNNYYLTRLVREVKREINIRVSERKASRQKKWKKAKAMLGMVMNFKT